MFKTKTRPLWRFSDFVVEELPYLIVEDPTVIPSKVKAILETMPSGQLAESYESNRELSLLDLKFAEVSIIRTSNQEEASKVPEILSKSVDWFCADGLNIPGLQYHELIEINPTDDMRTFTYGDVRKTEVLFYESHRLIEHRLRWVIDICERFLLNPNRDTQLHSAYESMFDFGPISSLMKGLRDMDKEHFQQFRNFLMKPCPVRMVEGPSGAYTWRVPFLDILIWGGSLPTSYLEMLASNLKYFSAEGRERFQQKFAAINQCSCVADFAQSDAEVVNAIRSEIAFMSSFRKMHHGAVKRQLPDVLTDEMDGTGTTNTGTFLKERRESMEELYADFLAAYPAV